MQVVAPELVSGKKVLLRLDIDVPLGISKLKSQISKIVKDDFRLKAGLPTLRLCLEHAESVIVMGHLGRPGGKEVLGFSVAPIYDWLEEQGLSSHMESGKLRLLENLRFEDGEDKADLAYAKELASLGDFFVNEAFAAHHRAASTTVLPALLPHAAGLRFAEEVRVLSEVKDNPKRPLITIIGGVKMEDKYQAVVELAKICDTVLVGGLLPKKIKEQGLIVGDNVILGEINKEGEDISSDTVAKFAEIIKGAKQVIWAGPVGKYEVAMENEGDRRLAEVIISSGIESIIGGGDTEAALARYIDQFSFVSVGGGSMLEFLIKGTLPTVEALK